MDVSCMQSNAAQSASVAHLAIAAAEWIACAGCQVARTLALKVHALGRSAAVKHSTTAMHKWLVTTVQAARFTILQ